jgi:hypothetical protein
MRYLAGYWPILAFPVGGLVQPDLLILAQAQIGQRFGVGFWAVVALICIVATAKLYWSWWWWGWLGRFLEDVERIRIFKYYSRKALSIVRKEGLVDKAIDDLRLQRDPDRYRKHPLMRYGVITATMLMGAWPTPGPRFFAVPACRAIGYRPAIHVLALGNALRVVYLTAVAQGFVALLW